MNCSNNDQKQLWRTAMECIDFLNSLIRNLRKYSSSPQNFINLTTLFAMCIDSFRGRNRRCRIPRIYLVFLCFRSPIVGAATTLLLKNSIKKLYLLVACILGLYTMFTKRWEDYELEWTAFTCFVILLMINDLCRWSL